MKLSFTFPVEVSSDSGWHYASSAVRNRGLHDYERTIVFSQALSEDQEKVLEILVQKLDNPGYCNWRFQKKNSNSYYFFSTLDSSD